MLVIRSRSCNSVEQVTLCRSDREESNYTRYTSSRMKYSKIVMAYHV